MKKLRWGIVGTADIARQNWRAIYDSGNSVVAAVASRDAEKSRQFIQTCRGHTQQERFRVDTGRAARGAVAPLLARSGRWVTHVGVT